MPRNTLNLSAAWTDNTDYNIVPRTPHSRSGRAEEGFTEEDLHDADATSFATYREEQREPLLASSTSTSFPTTGYRSSGDDGGAKRSKLKPLTGKSVLSYTPLLVGVIAAGVLLSLVVVSLTRPKVLDDAIGFSEHANTVLASSAIADDVVVATPQRPQPSFVDTIPPTGYEISYENYTKFPLTGDEYRHECALYMSRMKMAHGAYWKAPPHGTMDVAHHDAVPDYVLPESVPMKVCSKTITYQLDGRVGLVADLALMAQAAAFARERNRTFFVDDTYWNRGKWTDHFQDVRARQPGPEPACRRPPPNELVACPRLARHWVINSRTARYHFGHHFQEAYENPYKHEINRQKPIFERASESFKQTIRPNAHNAELIRSTRMEIAATLNIQTTLSPSQHKDSDISQMKSAEQQLHEHNPDPYVAVHIRRGDRKTGWVPHGGKHLPLEDYVQATYNTWSRLYSQNASTRDDVFPDPPITYIASDSHAAAHEFASAFPPSTAVFSLDSSTNPDLRALAPQGEYVQEEFDGLDEADRIRLTRGMVVDFALLSGLWAWPGEVVPGATICTLTSNVCKMSAVGLGWNRAMGFEVDAEDEMGIPNEAKRRWVEIDNGGAVSPQWDGYEPF
ncbi:hypothetical protein BDY19DRAFT_916313 [Irpex rosettiformis]|uniref:Uncharacterized protein n=1 Tax=Irpex rosettiformis TaxID=378272 RepID=A0ACB8UL99_9APHY|nr:hypothetical protein BDY19DRAFT_916313 [Irpex rosettiformis]